MTVGATLAAAIESLRTRPWGSDVPGEYTGPTYEVGASAGFFYCGDRECRWDEATHVEVMDHAGNKHYPKLADYFDDGDFVWQDNGDLWAFGPGEEFAQADWMAIEGEPGTMKLVKAVAPSVIENKSNSDEARRPEELRVTYGTPPFGKPFSKPFTGKPIVWDEWAIPEVNDEDLANLAKLLGVSFFGEEEPNTFSPLTYRNTAFVGRSDKLATRSPQMFFDLVMKKVEHLVAKVIEAVHGLGWPIKWGDLRLSWHSAAPTGKDGWVLSVEWVPPSAIKALPSERQKLLSESKAKTMQIMKDACVGIANTAAGNFVDSVKGGGVW